MIASDQPAELTTPRITVLADPIAYADSSESALLELFSRPGARDEYGIVDRNLPWPLYYHLTPRRKSLLSWLTFGPDADVLELGAGCGAVTSLLVRRCRSVTAVEGSLERARVIQARCRDAGNLEIVVGNAAELPYAGQFSHVVLVGVLEYARAYVQGAEPYARLLAQARKYLKPDGCLVLAIENAMGHKYLAGFPEDHLGRPYCGVNGYPGPFGVRTFDRPTLGRMLADAGFAAQSWFYPTPDYKIPDAVLAEAAFATPGFDPLPLLDLPTQDYDRKRHPAFNERTFVASAHRAGSAPHFMNSFLVLAADTPDAPTLAAHADLLAVLLNADGCPPVFQTRTSFHARPDGSIQVRRANLHGLAPYAGATGSQHLKPVEPYHAGYESILERILRLLDTGEEGQAGQALAAWMELTASRAAPATEQAREAFRRFCAQHVGRTLYAEHVNAQWVPGALLDAHPGNVLRHPGTGDVRYIDLEWRLGVSIPLQLLIDRGVNLVGQKIATLRRYYHYDMPEQAAFPSLMEQQLARSAFYRNGDTTSLALFQGWFHAALRAGSLEFRLPPT